MSLIGGLVAILTCQLAGEFLVELFALPLPGPVLGMLLFLIALLVRRPGPDSGLVRAGDGLLVHLQMFFIPPAVGVVVHAALIGQHWLPIVVGMLASWAVTLLAIGGIAQLLARFAPKGEPT